MSVYMSPTRVCDLVMKGGITSGVVYPPAIDEIARKFWFCGIGGTSAGAIAAALAAAAEFCRRNGSPEGYEQLVQLPKEISGDGRLLALFKPDGPTRGVFSLLTRSLEMKQGDVWFPKLRLGARALWLLITQSPIQRIVDNGLGMCTGMALDNRSPSDPLPPLTEWLSAKLDAIAGKPDGESPLTFGELMNAPPPSTPPGLGDTMVGSTGIYLQLVSTCLTFGRPYALPYLDNRFSFSPAAFRRLFPEYVVRYMEDEGRKVLEAMRPDSRPPDGLLPLPVGGKLPVIVGVRMSLSFPVLFSAIPMHYMNLHEDPPIHEEVHFADGGITSNLPVYFFDSPFPRWPTLAINLQYTQKPGDFGRRHVDASHVWMTSSNSDGTLEMFARFLGSSSALGKMGGLAGAIFRSAQVWSDNSFLKLPGYRDRVAEIWLDPHEGGMNLNMPENVINDLVRYGQAAGRRLTARFAEAPPTEAMSWDGHRWTRYRAQMASLVHYLRRWERSVSNPMPGDRRLAEMLSSIDAAPSYKFRAGGGISAEERRAAAEDATDQLMDFIAELNKYPEANDGKGAIFRPFDGGPQSSLCLRAQASLTPLEGPRAPTPED